MCMTRMSTLPADEPITVSPMRAFPVIRDLVTDVSFNYAVARQIPPFQPRPEGGRRHLPHGAGRRRPRPGVPQVHRVLPLPERLPRHPRPRGEQGRLRRPAFLRPPRRARDAPARHPRPPTAHLRGVRHRLCNITKCCTEVCPEGIHITDNAIIPLKERVVDARYDPVAWLGRKILRRPSPLPAAEAARHTARAPRAYGAPGGAGDSPSPAAAGGADRSGGAATTPATAPGGGAE